MEQILTNNFDGRRFSVPALDGKALDCMFFPFNEEKVLTVDELETLKSKAPAGTEQDFAHPEYLKYPTVIFFNQNA